MVAARVLALAAALATLPAARAVRDGTDASEAGATLLSVSAEGIMQFGSAAARRATNKATAAAAAIAAAGDGADGAFPESSLAAASFALLEADGAVDSTTAAPAVTTATPTTTPTPAPPVKVMYGDPTCPCVGIEGLPGNQTYNTSKSTAVYPLDTGSSCKAWDKNRYAGFCTDDLSATGNEWCSQKWCFVDPCNCQMDKMKSKYSKTVFKGRPLYLSYATCGQSSQWTAALGGRYVDECQGNNVTDCKASDNCAWTGSKCVEKELNVTCTTEVPEAKYGKKKCRCIGLDSLDFPGNSKPSGGWPIGVGGRCEAWSSYGHKECKGDAKTDPAFCGQKWCYVDPCDCDEEAHPTQDFANATFRGAPLYYSYATCGSQDNFTASHNNASCSLLSKAQCNTTKQGCVWSQKKCVPGDLDAQCAKAFASPTSENSFAPRGAPRADVLSVLLAAAALAVSAAWGAAA